jgi:hypothetical protein
MRRLKARCSASPQQAAPDAPLERPGLLPLADLKPTELMSRLSDVRLIS